MEHRYCLAGHTLDATAQFCSECGGPAAWRAVGSHDGAETADRGAAVARASDVQNHPAVSGHRLAEGRPRRGRSILLGVVALLVVGLAGATGAWYQFFRVTDEDRYIEALRSAELLGAFGTDEAALSQGHAFSKGLSKGGAKQGFKSQEVAVRYLCPAFAKGFAIVPTPGEQAATLASTLRDQGLGGVFASDAAAVAHAKGVCANLDAGAAQQGPGEDAVAVSVYCNQYEAGFEVLKPFDVHGTLDLMDLDASIYFPSIDGSSKNCYGSGGYSDIGPGAEVVVKDGTGLVLTTTSLGRGSGFPPVECEFGFDFTIMDGAEGGYTVSISDRGEFHYTAAELKLPDAIALTLG